MQAEASSPAASSDDVAEIVEPLSVCPPNVEIGSFSSERMSQFSDWLPEGWTVETKIRKSGRSAGTKYKVYMDPLTGLKFHSKNEVRRYLQNPNLDKRPKIIFNATDKKDQTGTPVQDKPDWLPPGWTLQIRARNGFSSCSSYKVYICPVTNTKFYSKKQVLDYLSIAPGDAKSFEKVEAQIVKKVEGLPDGWVQGFRYRKSRNGTKRADKCYIDPVSGYEFYAMTDVYRYLESGDIRYCRTKPKKRDENDINTPIPTHQAESHPPNKETKSNSQATTAKRSLFTEQTQGETSSKTEMEIDNSSPRKDTQFDDLLNPIEHEILDLVKEEKYDEAKPIQLDKSLKKRGRPFKILASKKSGSGKSTRVKPMTTPARSSARLANLKAKAAEKNTKNEEISKSETDKDETELHASDNMQTEPSLSSLFGETSVDPCIEFAFKTLTGDIPVLEDHSTIEGYFRKKPATKYVKP